MRLICPKCAAQYEVDADMIPGSGREVHCSACGNTWFQPGSDAYQEPLSLGESARRNDPLARAISRIVSEDTSAVAPSRPAIDQKVLDILHEEAARETEARIAEGTLLPGDLPQPVFSEDPPQAAVPVRHGGGFWVGFLVVIVLAGAAALAYVYAVMIGQQVPDLEPALTWYVHQVDAIRVWLDTSLRALM